tara:strand:+ start:1016 stop:1177 length:162 start_codon:yes stop_codon:yes gene_type:complete
MTNKEALNEMILCIEEELKRIRLNDNLSVEEKFKNLQLEAKMILQEKLFMYQD